MFQGEVMRQMYVTNPRAGHTTLAWATAADVEAGITPGPEAPADAEVVDEETARAVFNELMQRGAVFQVAPAPEVQVHEFPAEATELVFVPSIQGG